MMNLPICTVRGMNASGVILTEVKITTGTVNETLIKGIQFTSSFPSVEFIACFVNGHEVQYSENLKKFERIK